MTGLGRRAAAVILALVVTTAIVALSRVPYSPPAPESMIRLSWRVRSGQVEACRAPTPEELAELPAHMRPQEICETHLVPYRLRVDVDGRPRVDELVYPSGARGDRPIYVLRDLGVEAGTHRLSVTFERSGPPIRGGRADESVALPQPRATEPHRPAQPSDRGDEGASRAPSSKLLALDTAVVLRSGEVALVTADEARAALLVVQKSGVRPSGEGS